jgi:hypothetical protein
MSSVMKDDLSHMNMGPQKWAGNADFPLVFPCSLVVCHRTKTYNDGLWELLVVAIRV